ncbi:hypothetical protein Tco_0561554 [Tanacetum coccineum]
MVLRIVRQETNVVCDKESDNSKENSDESLVEEQVSQDKSSFVESSPNADKETIFPVNKKVEFTKPKNHEKPVKKSARKDLHLDDAEGTDYLPTATIFEELARMGAKSTAWNEFSSSMASLIICLATNQKKFNLSKYIFDVRFKHLMKEFNSFLEKKQRIAQAKEMLALEEEDPMLERNKMSRPYKVLKRLKKVGKSRRVDLLCRSRKTEDELMFDTGVLDADEMPMEAKVDEKDEQSTKPDDSTAGEAVTTASVKDTKGSRKKMFGRKRAGKEQQQESSKKQKVEEEKESDEVEEVDEDDEAELKNHLVIKKDEDIAIDAIPLLPNFPVILITSFIKKYNDTISSL